MVLKLFKIYSLEMVSNWLMYPFSLVHSVCFLLLFFLSCPHGNLVFKLWDVIIHSAPFSFFLSSRTHVINMHVCSLIMNNPQSSVNFSLMFCLCFSVSVVSYLQDDSLLSRMPYLSLFSGFSALVIFFICFSISL